MTKKITTLILVLMLVFCTTISAYSSETEAAGGENTAPAETENRETQQDSETTDEEDEANLSDSEEETPAEDPKDEENDKEKANDKTDTKKTQAKQTVKTVSKYQKGLAAYIRSKNGKIGKKWSVTLAGYFIKSGKKNNIDPKVLMALALRESNFNSKAKSKYGHKGMMQCTASFAKSYGYKEADLYRADVSIEIAARYLRTMKNKHETYQKAIACYVCGSGAVERGVHSREPGRSVMKVRNKIQDFLEKNHYV